MSDEMFVRCCAPTLAGIKTGSMFSCEYAGREEMTDELRSLNRVLSAGGMCILPLRFHDGKALLYLFRPDSLQRDMKNRAAREILDEAGYSGLRYQQCIRRLIRRIGTGDEFPHEIGLFLSYPPEDVRGFIHLRIQNHRDRRLRNRAAGLSVYSALVRLIWQFREDSSCCGHSAAGWIRCGAWPKYPEASDRLRRGRSGRR